MPEDFNEKSRKQIQDYFDSEITKAPGLNEPAWQLYEKPARRKQPWLPSLVFNLVLAAIVVVSIPFLKENKPALAEKIEIVNDKYKINEKIIAGLYALKNKL